MLEFQGNCAFFEHKMHIKLGEIYLLLRKKFFVPALCNIIGVKAKISGHFQLL